MPVCEKCQTPYDEWQHFCLHCGHYVRAEPLPFQQCPQCGGQTALGQNFCPECAAPLKDNVIPLEQTHFPLEVADGRIDCSNIDFRNNPCLLFHHLALDDFGAQSRVAEPVAHRG